MTKKKNRFIAMLIKVNNGNRLLLTDFRAAKYQYDD